MDVISIVLCLVLLAAAGAFLCLPVLIVQEAVRSRRHQRTFREGRKGETYQDFARPFQRRDIPEHILQKTYETFSHEIFWPNKFPSRPSDSLSNVYRLGQPGGLDRDLVIHDLAERCGLKVIASTLKPPPATVEELIYVLASLYNAKAGERDRTTLLRPAGGPDIPSETLLRPAKGQCETDPEILLRPHAQEDA